MMYNGKDKKKKKAAKAAQTRKAPIRKGTKKRRVKAK
tara:strand:+ start:277 stop:387 length:111 start_codon:yes stop_codon:yes gene_type:complete